MRKASFPFFAVVLVFVQPCFCVAQKTPYSARIVENNAAVYSSPGKQGYKTQLLKAGEKVEVFQINSEGWCAIRPPIGSFSWVSGLYLDVGMDGIGRVGVDELSSRIGTQFGDQCRTIQVQLQKGEKVMLLERVETPENSASPIWYKISPPKGEFRWIRVESLSPVPQEFQNLAKKAVVAKKRQFAANSLPKDAVRQVGYEQPFSEGEYSEDFSMLDDSMNDSHFAREEDSVPDLPYESIEPEHGSPYEKSRDFPEDVRRESDSMFLEEESPRLPDSIHESFEPERPGTSGHSPSGGRVSGNAVPGSTLGNSTPITRNPIQRRTASSIPYQNHSSQTVPGENSLPSRKGLESVVDSPRMIYEPSGEMQRGNRIINPRIASTRTLPDPGANAGGNSDPYRRALAQLNQEVHLVMNRPVDDAIFETLLQKGRQLYESAPTETDRTKAYQLLATLEKSRTIRKSNANRKYQTQGGLNAEKMTQSALQPAKSQKFTRGLSQLFSVGNRKNSNGNSGAAPNSIAQNSAISSLAIHSESGVNPVVPSPGIYHQTAAVAGERNGNATTRNAISAAGSKSALKAVGKLGWFQTRPEGHPPFALVNENNEIITFITPESGVNLKSHINKQIGVDGVSGFYIDGKQRSPHIRTTAVFPMSESNPSN